MTDPTHIDYPRLFKLRLVVARHGEMDGARWWNTDGLLGPQGARLLRRGFPATHYFAQARAVFAVARSRCEGVFNLPSSMTLWNLPAEIEDQFEERWHDWLDEREQWASTFQRLAEQKGADLLGALEQFDLLSQAQARDVSRLRRSAENRAVPLPGPRLPDDEVFTLLAAAFSKGAPGALAVPYARIAE